MDGQYKKSCESGTLIENERSYSACSSMFAASARREVFCVQILS